MKNIILSLLLLVATTTSVFAQKSDAVVVGHVVESANGKHIPYVTVTIKGTTEGTTTDATGHYMLKNLPVGNFTIVASAVGYETQSMDINLQVNKTIECKFSLTEQAIAVDQVVVSSTKNETNRKFSSSIVNVASAKLFDTTSSTNLGESMNFQPGLRTENTCGNCGAAQIRINGLEGQYSQILLDSRPIFSSLAGVYGIEMLPVSMIERVEVIRGGGSALFGSSAIGGVVNVITKDPLRNSVNVNSTLGIYEGGAQDLTTSFNGSFVTDDNKAGIYLFGMMRSRDAYDRNGDGFTETPEVDTETMGFRGYYKTSTYTKLTAEYHHITERRRGGNNLDLPPHESDIAEKTQHTIDGGGLTFDYFSPNYAHKFSLYTSGQQILRDSYYGAGQDPDAYGVTTDETFVGGGQYTYLYDGLVIPANLTVGAEYSLNYLHDLMPGYDRDLKQNTYIYGLFLQNEWTSDKFNLLIGGRLDKHNMIDNPIFAPRVSVRYSPIESIGLRASYSTGYRAPQAFNEDLHIEAVAGGVSLITLDPDLKPEYSRSFTLSADLYKSFGKVQTNLLLDGFYTELDDVFILEPGEDYGDNNQYWVRSNGSGATVKGISADLKVAIANKFDIQAGYTLQSSRYKEAEVWSDDVEGTREMFRSPDQYGYITASYNINDNFTTSVFGNYTGDMLVQHAAGYTDVDENFRTPSFWDMGVKLAYTFRVNEIFNIEIHGGVKNIFDQYQSVLDEGEFKDAGFVYGPTAPRTYFFGAKLMF
ncbi:MAG: TonB-dependent receptor [Rikenellaceae bacterium]